MANSMIPAGDFRTSYAADTTIFPTTTSRNVAIASIAAICFAPYLFSEYWLSLLIQIGIYGIAALGLNVLVGFTGQISIGHAAFFLFGAFSSAYLSTKIGMPAFFAIPLSGWAMVSASRLGLPTRYFGLFDWPNIGFLAGMPLVVAWRLVEQAVPSVRAASKDSRGLVRDLGASVFVQAYVTFLATFTVVLTADYA